MHEILEAVCTSLENISNIVAKTSNEERTLCEVHGWNLPTVTKHDLAKLPLNLSDRIRELSPDILDEEILSQFKDIPRRLQHMQATTIPQLFNGGNAVQAIPAYCQTLNSISEIINPLFSWSVVQDNKAMPTNLAKRLRSIQIEIDQIVPDKDSIKSQIKLIKEATEAAESLPTDLESLQIARNKVNTLANDSEKVVNKIKDDYSEVVKVSVDLRTRLEEADKIVSQCEEAYRITTTKGLAAAFEQRAKRLDFSMWAWVVGLLLTLALGAFVGSGRVEQLSKVLSGSDPKWGAIWMQLVLTLLSLGAPVWFAWLATKQIGQRFRLAEDYAFKASVAKAYEGYRKEAARIDEAFEARLFSSALCRLEEAPLRLVEEETHGSPWHELISSDVFRYALETIPQLRSTFVQLAKEGNYSVNKATKHCKADPKINETPTT